jgi:hypothetical protein
MPRPAAYSSLRSHAELPQDKQVARWVQRKLVSSELEAGATEKRPFSGGLA